MEDGAEKGVLKEDKALGPWLPYLPGSKFESRSIKDNFLGPFHPLSPHFSKSYRPPGSLGHKEETSADSMS